MIKTMRCPPTFLDSKKERQEKIIEEIYDKVLSLNGPDKESICYLLGELKGLI